MHEIQSPNNELKAKGFWFVRVVLHLFIFQIKNPGELEIFHHDLWEWRTSIFLLRAVCQAEENKSEVSSLPKEYIRNLTLQGHWWQEQQCVAWPLEQVRHEDQRILPASLVHSFNKHLYGNQLCVKTVLGIQQGPEIPALGTFWTRMNSVIGYRRWILSQRSSWTDVIGHLEPWQCCMLPKAIVRAFEQVLFF